MNSSSQQHNARGPAAENGTDGSNDMHPDAEATGDARRGLGVAQLVGSVFAAGMGVQSSKNRERDFTQGRAGTFILAGLVFTALFIGTVYGVVSLVLSSR